MACNLTGLFKRCFYTGWVGDHQEKPYNPKNSTYIFGTDTGNISDDEVLYQNENLKAVSVEPNDSPERYNSSNTKKACGMESVDESFNLEHELMELLDDDRKEENSEYFSMFDSDDSSGPGR